MSYISLRIPWAFSICKAKSHDLIAVLIPAMMLYFLWEGEMGKGLAEKIIGNGFNPR
jgi:hypothetical protein